MGTLLRKDWLILKRNWLYLVMFVWVPFVMMGSFWYLKSTLEFELTPEKHNLHGKFNIQSALPLTRVIFGLQLNEIQKFRVKEIPPCENIL